MSTIKRGSTATGHLVWGQPQPITPIDLNAPPIPPQPPVIAKATIESYETPVASGHHASHCVATILQGTPTQLEWQLQYVAGGDWQTPTNGLVPASQLTFDYFLDAGSYPIRLRTLVNGVVTDTTSTPRVIVVEPEPQPPKPTMTITFRANNGQYVCAEDGGNGAIHANRDVAGPWETFKRVPCDDGRYAYQSSGGYYLTAENGGGGVLSCNRTKIGPWECWRELLESGGISLQSDNGHFMCAEGGGGGEVNVTRSVAGPWETFNVPVAPPPGTVTTVHPDGHVWRRADGTAWRWKGVSAFQLCDRWLRGEDLTPFLSAYQGFNLLRVWSYTEGPNWVDPPWNSPTPDEAVAFVKEMNRLGWYVEWTLLTSSQVGRQAHALDEIHAFTAAGLVGLFLEASNEPEVQHDGIIIDTEPLKAALAASGYPYSNGYYKNTNNHWGTYLCTHTQRDSEWVRRSHDAMDIYNPPADAPPGTIPQHMPIILDEPAKLEDVSGDRVSDWKAYFGSSSFFGAGATFHSQTGKFAQPPTAAEQQLAGCALVGLNAFPEEAPLGPYSRVTDNTLRTYIVGSSMVRMRPTTLQAPQPGWTMIDSAGILWRR